MRNTLGKYGVPNLTGLTLHDLAEFIRRAGIDAGFTVKSEFPIAIPQQRPKKIDWVWLHEGAPRVAFEIEGINVAPSSLQGDYKKFVSLTLDSPECIKVVALYSVKNSHEEKAPPPGNLTPHEWVTLRWPADAPQVVFEIHSDTALFAAGGIEALQQRALLIPPIVGDTAIAESGGGA